MEFNMKTLAIIQARMGSSRLPGKTLANIHGKPMLQWLLERVKAVTLIDEIVVATTIDPSDDELAAWLATVPNISCFRGHPYDVLDRFYQASRGLNVDVIVRLTGDDPLKDPVLISQAISVLLENPTIDYASTFIKPTFPEGLDCEVMRTSVLERAHREAILPSEREHVTPYIWKNPQIFSTYSIEQANDHSKWRWTVDKPADLEFVRAVYGHFLNRALVSYEELVSFLHAHPEIVAINAGTIRQEGYLKSLSKEQT
jgi:spore coat polysaccharide biosynthesis protein SpsF